MFVHKGKRYELRITRSLDNSTIAVYQNGIPANGIEYMVKDAIAHDMKMYAGRDAVPELLRDAKQDVIDGLWERILKARQDDSLDS